METIFSGKKALKLGLLRKLKVVGQHTWVFEHYYRQLDITEVETQNLVFMINFRFPFLYLFLLLRKLYIL